MCNSPEFASLPPNVIVPTLADRGIYIASELSFYRVLKSANQLKKRSRECQYKRPDVLRAVAPNQVWSWDISYLPSWVRGQHFYLYMIVDIYSRKIIAAEVFASESGKHAAELLQRAVWNEKCSSSNLVLHSDNGAPMRSYTLLAKMYALGLNRPGFPGECFICELRLPDHCFRWKHNKLFLLLPEGYGPAFPAIVDCYTSPPT